MNCLKKLIWIFAIHIKVVEQMFIMLENIMVNSITMILHLCILMLQLLIYLAENLNILRALILI